MAAAIWCGVESRGSRGIEKNEIHTPKKNVRQLSSVHFQKIESSECVVSSSRNFIPKYEFPFGFNPGLQTATE